MAGSGSQLAASKPELTPQYGAPRDDAKACVSLLMPEANGSPVNTPLPLPYPTLHIKRKPASIFDYQFEDFEFADYQHHPAIKAPVAV